MVKKRLPKVTCYNSECSFNEDDLCNNEELSLNESGVCLNVAELAVKSDD